jgi:DNA-binding NtrC family response regulator
MSKPLRLLLVEDSEEDARLLLRELERAGYEPVCERVDSPEAMAAALERHPWDAILADHHMPRFSAPLALKVLTEKNLDLPFIVVSGVLPEESAIKLMRAGARHFIPKQNLKRLASALDRELAHAEVRRARLQGMAKELLSAARIRTSFVVQFEADYENSHRGR